MAGPTPTLRPLSCWKSILRHTRQFKATRRTLTTYRQAKPLPPAGTTISAEPLPHVNRHIKAIAPPPSIAAKFREPVKDFTSTQITLLDPIGARTKLFSKANPDAAKVGDILLVRLKTGDPFAGVCINIRRRGVDTAILLRSALTRVGVEMWYKIYSPNVEGVEVVRRKERRARRARLTYMRKPKHDLGSVQKIVTQYQKSRGGARVGLKGKGKKAKR